MAHHTYHTDAYVLGGINTGESHRYVLLFTEDLGLIHAVVRSVRKEQSRLRYSLQEYSKTHTSLVRGRDVWRVTGAREHINIYYELRLQKERQALISRIHLLLRRLLHGEEENRYLFSVLSEIYTALLDVEIDDRILDSLECASVLRILHSLGYLTHDEKFTPLFQDTLFTKATLEHTRKIRSDAISEINRSLKASHL